MRGRSPGARRRRSSFGGPPAAALIRLSPDDARWLRLWESSPQRSPFSHPAAARALADAFGLGLSVRAVAHADGWLEAGALVFEKRRGPFSAAALPPVCPIHTPLLAGPLSPSATHRRQSPLDRLLAAYPDGLAQATFALSPALPDLRPFSWAGWTARPRFTYVLDLSGDLRAGYSSSTRRLVHHEADAYEVAEDATAAALSVRLMMQGYARHGTTLGLDDDALVRLAEAVVGAGLGRVMVARRGGAVEAAVVVATDGRTAFYWLAGSVPGPAMTVLIDGLLHRLAGEGVARFDFCGANTPTIAEFKRKFGPALTPLPQVRIVRHPVLRLLDRARRR